MGLRNRLYHHKEACRRWKVFQIRRHNKYFAKKLGAGLQSASSCYWDSTTDGTVVYRFESKTMHAITQVWALALTN
eukprot:TRINITY_DN935_c0_g1_i1.p2 TRINITY_DN935_c0_g1~~TRINITY_DN935_c0_g1_i1.p2  ORF type:complete len:76 (-),score=9.77 TRINITY_DN935_c0_g1_i1:70-297(-)